MQRRVDARVFRQPRVVDLLAGPGELAEVAQADHARTALERVERAPHQRDVAQAFSVGRQVLQRLACRSDDLARFLDEDLAHLGVVFEAGVARRHRFGVGPHLRHRRRDWHLGDGHRHAELAHGLGQVGAHRCLGFAVMCIGQRLLRLRGHARQAGLVVDHGALRQLFELARQVFVAQVRQARGMRQRLCFLHQAQGLGAIGRSIVEGAHAQGRRPGRGHEAAFGRIETEQRLGQQRLHVEHIDEETQRTEVVGQPVEAASLRHALDIDFGAGELVHRVAHVRHGERALFEVQHREHAAHGRQLRRHRHQHLALRRVTEIAIDLLFDLGQRGAQFVYQTAHGLAIGDAAVELLDPGLQRLYRAAGARQVNALRHLLRALTQARSIELTFFNDGVEPQHGGGHLHGQCRGWRCARAAGLGRGHLQRMCQHVARWEEPAERIAEQGEGFGQPLQPAQVAAGDCRPHLLGRGHALACLGDGGRFEAAQSCRFVVGTGAGVAQLPGLAHRAQARRGHAGRHLGARAEEEQVARQPLGHVVVAAHTGAQLRQQARGHAFGVDVAVQQAMRLRVEEGRRQAPHGGRQRGAGTGTELGAEIAHVRHRRRIAAAHQRQHQRLHAVARMFVGDARHQARLTRQFLPTPVLAPQVGRVDAVATREQLHRAVLREQRDAGNRPACQAALQEVEHRERGRLDRLDGRQVHQSRLAREALHRGFTAAQHARRDAQTDEFERTHALVQLRSRSTQDGHVGAVDVRHADGLRFFQKAPQRLVRRVQRTLQFARHPGQRAEVVAAARRGSCHHGRCVLSGRFKPP